MPVYGKTKDEVQQLAEKGILHRYGEIMCLACHDEGKPTWHLRITVIHLTKIHPDEFPNMDVAMQHYKRIYPGAEIISQKTKEAMIEEDFVEKFKNIDKIKIEEMLDKSGGLGNWSQRKTIELFLKLENLLSRYSEEEELDKVLSTINVLGRLLDKITPAKTKIEMPATPIRMSKKDAAAIDKLTKVIGKYEIEQAVDNKVLEEGLKT